MICALTGKRMSRSQLIPLDLVSRQIADRIRADHPELGSDVLVSRAEIDRYRAAYVEELLLTERGELSALDRQVAQSLAKGELISENLDIGEPSRRSFGERASDLLAAFGGSWSFLIVFGVCMSAWIAVNLRATNSFDPYPFILLNLVLSCIAAIQAPIIMMSQRRQETRDRERALNDYRVNLKAELEIRHLHDKIDHLISKQWQRLAEIQALQIEIMQGRERRDPEPPRARLHGNVLAGCQQPAADAGAAPAFRDHQVRHIGIGVVFLVDRLLMHMSFHHRITDERSRTLCDDDPATIFSTISEQRLDIVGTDRQRREHAVIDGPFVGLQLARQINNRMAIIGAIIPDLDGGGRGCHGGHLMGGNRCAIPEARTRRTGQQWPLARASSGCSRNRWTWGKKKGARPEGPPMPRAAAPISRSGRP
jgi:uncharacterized membrane protein